MTLKRRYVVGGVIATLLVALFALSAMATDAEVYLASDSNGQNRVTNIQEGDEVWIVVYDPDENIDCDDLDKISPDIKLMDPKTGAYILWVRNLAFDPNNPNPANEDYLIETGPDTGVFVSNRSFQIGTRDTYNIPRLNTHVVDDTDAGFPGGQMFVWGNYLYDGPATAVNVAGDRRGWFNGAWGWILGRMLPFVPLPGTQVLPNEIPRLPAVGPADAHLIGRFENMDTLVVAYQDVNDASDVAMSLAKIIDTEATISWGQEVYKDANGAAQITVVDADENLNCNAIEYVPVFILVNPGSWNQQTRSRVNSFCSLKRTGGVNINGYAPDTPLLNVPIRWFNIYDSALPTGVGIIPQPPNAQLLSAGTYYIQYPVAPLAAPQVTFFNTADAFGVCQVMFWAQETGQNTGVFRLQLNSLLRDLGFTSLDVRDVLVAYYLDPNDFDDFKLATAYIEQRQHSITSFVNSTRVDQSVYWIGRDPIYVQVIDSNANVDPCCPEQVLVHICDPHEEDDSEWALLDETSSNSPVFFTHSGMELLPVWDALGVGLAAFNGGYQLQLDNWKFEVYNEDDVYARYNDVYYNEDGTGLAGLGDSSMLTAFPPTINRVRVDNDVSFDVMSIGDTQVYNGTTTQMYFRDRQANRVSGYVNSDCVFVEVIDPDQDEDQYRRERIDGFWDGQQNIPFGPVAFNWLLCGVLQPGVPQTHPVNALLGATHIMDNAVAGANGTQPKLYVLNPRNSYWRVIDLMETAVNSGIFVSVICIDLVSQYVCAPTLGVLPGDTIIAVYQDPSNHSDSAWISIKVGVGGGGTPPGQASTTKFANASGNVVTQYTDADSVYVKVVDPSHAGAASVLAAVEIDGMTFDLAPLTGATTDTFITAAISQTALGVGAGDSITATYTDPVDTTDSSSDTVSIVSSVLDVTGVIAKPNPFETDTTFAFAEGSTGLADTFSVSVYDLAGHIVWTEEVANASELVWDGTNEAGASLANGPYIFVAVASDGTDTFTYKGMVFIKQ